MPDQVRGRLSGALQTHRAARGLPGLFQDVGGSVAAGSCRTERTAQAVQRRRHQKTRCIGERKLVSKWASESRDLLGCESEQGPPRWRHGAETLQLQILAAFPALANRRRTLSTGHLQGHIGAGVDELTARVATSSRGCWLSAASLKTKPNCSPCGLPLRTCCPSANYTLHAGSVACYAYSGQLPYRSS